MNARDEILLKLRRQIVDSVTQPEVVNGDWIRFEHPVAKFRSMVEMVGGTCTELSSASDLTDRLAQFPQWNAAKRVFSNLPEVPGNVDLDTVNDPHELEDLDFVVYRAQFAVAENGALYLSDANLKHRSVFFITQYLILVVRTEEIVHNMHEAYARAQMPQPGFGLFLAGPSKTADIEQSLVIGAHGSRELQVYIDSGSSKYLPV